MGKKFMLLGCMALCLYLTPIQSAIWNGTESPVWINTTAEWMTGKVMADAAKDHSVLPMSYYHFGQLFMLVYGILLLLWVTSVSFKTHRSGIMALVGLSIAAMAGLYGYIFSQYYPTFKHEIFLFIEVPGLVIALIALTVRWFHFFGANLIKWAGLGMVPLALLITHLVAYVPHGPMLAIILSSSPFILFEKHKVVEPLINSPKS